MLLLEELLRTKPVVTESLPDWWQRTSPTRTHFLHSIDRAIVLGAHAHRLGFAFLGGYTSAITALDPEISPDAIGALCATESGGGHPRAILTSLESDRLNGTKHFVSGGSFATVLLVVAKTGDQDGRPVLKVARVGARNTGVRIDDGAPLGFIPEISHGVVTFTDAHVDAVLDGDGYERYLKPFRTIEDLHVFGAVLGCLISNGRGGWAQSTTERLLAIVAAISNLGREDPRSPGVHLALAGVLGTATTLIDSLDFAALAPHFERDRPLLGIAARAREQRRVKAWAGFPAP